MRRAPALHTHAHVSGVEDVRILKILSAAEAANGDYPQADILIHDSDAGDGVAGSFTTRTEPHGGRIAISAPRDEIAIRAGDVIRVRPKSGQISIVYRRGSHANTLFVTERCNSLCVMCSQPPRDEDDSWRVGELLKTIALVDKNEAQLGFTGGEPTLLGDDLATLLSACRTALPNTHLHVLTNGRRFADHGLARTLTEAGGDKTVWAVPLYADVARAHDAIVVAPGAFEETLSGLFALAQHKARVEIRIVLHAMSVPRLSQLASYIYRRMPFVEHVAFMGLEPMGFARSNRERLWIDPADYACALAEAVHHLAARDMNVSIYNLPLCVLSKDLWPYARQSISDWKNVDDPACDTCVMKDQCSGFFLSAGAEWRSRAIKPIKLEDEVHELA
jgi:His-Xaa-Ser system radical SAM maturase HxsC